MQFTLRTFRAANYDFIRFEWDCPSPRNRTGEAVVLVPEDELPWPGPQQREDGIVEHEKAEACDCRVEQIWEGIGLVASVIEAIDANDDDEVDWQGVIETNA